VQSKLINDGTGEPDLGSIEKFIRGVEDLLNAKFERFNTKLTSRKAEIIQALNDPDWTLKGIVAYTGSNKLSSHASDRLAQLKSEINDTTEYLEIVALSQPELYSALVSGRSGKPITLEIGLRSWGKVAVPYQAFYGQVNASEIADWWKTHRAALFAKNLRSVLGDTDVNKEIRETLETAPEVFWYFNNGITIIAKRIVKTLAHGADTDFGTFHCEDLSVVNGAQTVATIGRFAESSTTFPDKAYVVLRLISMENASDAFGESVTKTNNRQNRIEVRDFVSQDPQQLRIKAELIVDQIEYQVLRSEGFKSGPASFDLVEGTTAMGCATGSADVAIQVKREIGKIWENIKKPPYILLFNDKVPGPYVWQCVQTQRRIDLELDAVRATLPIQREQSILVWGNRIVASVVFNVIKPMVFQQKGFQFDKLLTDPAVNELVRVTAAELIKQVGAQYPVSYVATLFKNPTKSSHLHSATLAAINSKTAAIKQAIQAAS
jgi:hypothetical protein